MAKPRRHKTHLARKLLLGGLAFVIVLVVVSLLNFVDQIPAASTIDNEKTDAIVVLTGGSNRLDEGLTLLADNKAKKLFVSGVYRGVDVKRLLSLSRRSQNNLLCCIEVGHAAVSTEGNAAETKQWLEQEGYTSLRLVTASYHMPRSLQEFRHHMPGIQVIPHAVFPEQFKRNQWWRWPGTANLILTEYAKYLMSSVRQTWDLVSASPSS